MFFNLVVLSYLTLILFTILFQVGLMAGRPWGEWTMGGYHKGVLPTKLRIGALVSAIILVIFGLVIIDAISLFGISFGFPDFFRWVVVGYHVLAVIANTITQSKKERRLWQPITVLMLLGVLYLLLGI
jgi:hypothetical protein